ncbi:MAG: WD40 repeat domain-containing protein, partial [Planctomycetes bacterium]|nr:WD40 repeat domain-containing protein [Planctomycetota bacterium]
YALADGKLLRELAGHLGFIRSVAYTPDGSKLLSSADDGSIRVWTPQQAEAVAVLKGHRGGVLSVAVSPDGKQALSGGRDATVRLWDIASAKMLQTCEGSRGWVNCVAFAPDGQHGLSAGRDGCVRKWNLKNGKAVFETPNRGWVYALACARDGKTAYSASGTTIYSWDMETGQQRKSFSGHQSAVLCLSLCRDGQRLVSGSADTTLLVWEVK